MTQGKWSRLSPTQRADIWIRWKAGQTLHEIGRAYGKPHPTIRKVLLPRGGIPPIARRRSRLALTASEREECREGLPQVRRSVKSPVASIELRRR